jgi:diaminohydroxyphosphoribosylaminopyrimidine deaminase / 5-amino-6-(5-phosphoribosylamino)uracil reductase
MQRALELARQGIGLTSPNPQVGAVVLDSQGPLAGEGFHTYDGRKHGEILALEAADERARGGTLYLNLEPCSHQGRTGPCAGAVIQAGVARVVAAMTDPNPQVRGKGFEKLRAAGVEVVEGVMQAEARSLNAWFAKYIRTKLPFVTLKAGMTLDGKIAPPAQVSMGPTAIGAAAASSGWITSDEARAHAQTLRHANDAILVGVGTIVADDPMLTDRSGSPRRKPLLRVILDSQLRLPLTSRVVASAQDDVLVLCSMAEEKRRKELEARGVRVEQVKLAAVPVGRPNSRKVKQMPVRRRTGTGKPIMDEPRSDGRPDLRHIVRRLGELEITSVLIEGGALVNWAALAADVVDKVFLYYAPKILAGSGSVPFAAGSGFHQLSEAAQVKDITLHRFGIDFAVEGYIHDPYEETNVHRPY